MFVLELTYTAPMDRVEAAHADHMAWLEKAYETGQVLASGRKVPRDGGIVLVAAQDRAAVERLVAEDPFTVAGVCTYRITEFVPTRTAPALAAMREQPAS
jgi:uncharacterized protein YciI